MSNQEQGLPYPMPGDYKAPLPAPTAPVEQQHPVQPVPTVVISPSPTTTTTTATVVQPAPSGVIYVGANPLAMQLSSVPASLQCQHCHTNVITLTAYKNGTLTWLSVGGICLFGCWLGCCLIPFCVNELKDVEHICPSCHRVVGVYRRI